MRRRLAVAATTLVLGGAFAVVPTTSAFAAYSCGTEVAAGTNYMYSGYYTGTTVQPSSSGVSSAGIEAQCLLKRRGYNPGTVDGIFGTNSQNAAKAFQRRMNSAYRAGLTVDGKVGPRTWPYLRDLDYYDN
jgi:hypothetical protein